MLIHAKKVGLHNTFIALTYLLSIVICYFIIPFENRTTYIFYMSILTIALVFITLSDLIKENKISYFFLIIGIFVLGTIMAFRAQTGIDDIVYRNYFLNAGNKSLFSYILNGELEVGYSIINYILYYLTAGNYNIAQSIITYFSFILWGKALQKNKTYGSLPVLALLLWTQYYFLIMRAGLIRIFVAIPIVFYAIHFVWERQWKKYIFYILIASLFHMSSLIMLILLLLSIKEEWFFKHWGYFIIVLAVLIPIVFVFIAKILSPILGSRYATYANIGNFSISINSFDVLPIWLIGIYYYQVIKEDSERQRYIVGMILISTSMLFSVFSSMIDLGRLTYLSNLGILVVISGICKKKSSNIIEYGLSIILIIYAIFYLMYTTFLNQYSISNIFPYVSFWGTI